MRFVLFKVQIALFTGANVVFYKEREERIAKSAKERIPNPVKMFRGLAIHGNNWGINTIWHNIMSIPFQLQKSFHPNLQLSSIHTWQTQF